MWQLPNYYYHLYVATELKTQALSIFSTRFKNVNKLGSDTPTQSRFEILFPVQCQWYPLAVPGKSEIVCFWLMQEEGKEDGIVGDDFRIETSVKATT